MSTSLSAIYDWLVRIYNSVLVLIAGQQKGFEKLDLISNRLDAMTTWLSSIEKNVAAIGRRLDTMDTQLASVEATQAVHTGMLQTTVSGISEILAILEFPPPPEISTGASHVIFEVKVGDSIFEGEDTMAVQMKNSQHLSMSVKYTDKFGNPAKVQGVPVWDLSDPSFGSLRVADDGLRAYFDPSGPSGTCQINNTADADLGEGVKNIVGTIDVNVLPGDAVMVAIDAEVVDAQPKPSGSRR
jgi:hypothetical protein